MQNNSLNAVYHFPNGITLLSEKMDWCESVASTILVPAGSNHDPNELRGIANLTCEMALRGAGNYGSRELIEAFENLGTERSESLGNMHTVFSMATLASNLVPSCKLLADIIRRPHFPEEQLDAGKMVVVQEILSIEDDPGRKVMLELNKNFLNAPWGYPETGTLESVEAITINDLRQFHANAYQPDGMIISVAGKFDWEQLIHEIDRLFGDWQPQITPMIIEGERGPQEMHISHDSTQTHIGLAYDEVPFRDPDYMRAWGAVNILSGGMSSRLFTEIREKRGLCYSVGASYFTLRERGGVTCYCGTSTDRAQESLDMLVAELKRLAEGVTEKEVELLKIRAKTTMVMQQESTDSRASSIARDWYHLGRIRSMQEIMDNVNKLSKPLLDDFLISHPIGPFHLVTLGKQPLIFDVCQ